MVKAGLTEDVILDVVNLKPGQYSLNTDDLIALKKANVPSKVIAAMISKSQSGSANLLPPPPPNPAAADAPAAQPAQPVVSEIGVYYKKADAWADVQPEVVNWKTGGVLKNIGSAGIVKGDVNGHINGPHSPNAVKTPLEFLIYTPEGTAITEYQLLRLRDTKDFREFRTVTGGVLHVSGGATRDLLPFESKKIAPRTYVIVLPSITTGEYGFLPPGAVTSSHASSSLGKIYSFRVLE
ncbi:MAG TPA: hypothetical protein VGV35_05725 [Bryobacteraceae bacterium]|nr:hypothetical protein [Bryobacteraceae bacterium]